MKRNLILTTVHRIRPPALAPFFQSLKATGYEGDIVVFSSGSTAAETRQLEDWGAQVVNFRFRGKHVSNYLAAPWWLWRRAFASGLSERRKEGLAHAVFHLYYRRHLLYLEFLRAYGAQYRAVFLTDCRDVFFQTDLFSWDFQDGLHVFLEEESQKIGKCSHNSRWIRSLFGADALRKLGDETVSCAGTVLGDVAAMTDYLQAMTTTAMRVKSLRQADGDQGIHNYLVRTGGFDNVEIHANRAGPVMTLGAMQWTEIRRDQSGRVINESGRVVPTLHQYDRIPELRDALQSGLKAN